MIEREGREMKKKSIGEKYAGMGAFSPRQRCSMIHTSVISVSF